MSWSSSQAIWRFWIDRIIWYPENQLHDPIHLPYHNLKICCCRKKPRSKRKTISKMSARMCLKLCLIHAPNQSSIITMQAFSSRLKEHLRHKIQYTLGNTHSAGHRVLELVCQVRIDTGLRRHIDNWVCKDMARTFLRAAEACFPARMAILPLARSWLLWTMSQGLSLKDALLSVRMGWIRFS